LEQALENEPELGEIVKGRVLRIDEEGVVVDIGSKSEGIIPREEFLDARGEFSAQVGDEVDVLLERRENRDGLVVLSKRKVDKQRSWNAANMALANGTSLEGIALSKCKGGFVVDLGGVQAFLPGSHMDVRPVKDPDTCLNQRLQFKVIKLNRERGNIVVSRRNHLIDELNQQRSQVISELKPGRLVKGVVKNLTNYGAFIDIGGVDGLLHINDMAWSKVTNPRQVVKTGKEIEVLVLSIDEATGKIALGLKQKSEDPWVNIAAKYPVESLIEAEVVSLTDFGAFLRIENEVEGLLPISEISWTKRLRHPKEILKVGDSLRVKILALDPQAKKITLGLRQTEPEPFALFMENFRNGQTLDGEVKSITKYGAFVELVEGVTGLLHISDMSWDGSLKNPGELVKVGERITVKILEIQADRKKISLGLKQLQEDPWIVAAKKYSVGRVVKAKVVRNTKFGVFVQMEPGVEGLIHITQLEKGKERSEPKPLPEGEYVQAKIIKVNSKEHKIALSIREFMQDQEQVEMKKYLEPANKPGISLGEISGLSREELLKRFPEKPENE
jgi:small subunit ribosomal protein S1